MRQRIVKPELWQHDRLSELAVESHMLAAALLNYADDAGYFKAQPTLIQGALFPNRPLGDKIQTALLELEKIGYIEIGHDAEGRPLGRICKFNKHQWINRPSESFIKSQFIANSSNAHGGLMEGSRSPHGVINHKSLIPNPKSEEEKNTDPPCGSDSLKEEKKKISARSDSKQSSEPTTVPDDLKGLFLYESDAKLCARYPELLKSWKVSFPGLDVLQIIKKAHAWEVANPTKRKKNRPVFLNAWLSRENDRPRKTQSGGSGSNLEMVGWE